MLGDTSARRCSFRVCVCKRPTFRRASSNAGGSIPSSGRAHRGQHFCYFSLVYTAAKIITHDATVVDSAKMAHESLIRFRSIELDLLDSFVLSRIGHARFSSGLFSLFFVFVMFIFLSPPCVHRVAPTLWWRLPPQEQNKQGFSRVLFVFLIL